MVKENKTKWIVVGLLLGILIAAMDNTIVSTAMGRIISNLGEMEKFIWVTSAYMITSVASMMIYGKLSDMYGRKRFFLIGMGLFLLGSFLCGITQNMNQLIACRAFQGIGGGAITPIAFTIIFDVVPIEKRGKITGLFGAAFGAANLFGPLLGAFFTDNFNWRWIFYINIPLGLISFALLLRFYMESENHKKQKIDWLGAFLLVVSVASLMFALELGGRDYPWNSIQVLGLFSLFAVCLVIFLFVESKVSEPIVPMDLFKKRLFASSQVINFFYGSVFIIAIMYIPIFVQGVFSGTATNAGLILLPLTLGSVAGSQIGGRFAAKTSYRNIMFASVLVLIVGVFLLGTLTVDVSRWIVSLYMVITGLGVGVSFSLLNMSSVHEIDFRQRGSASSSVIFFREIGMVFGITIFGTIQNNLMRSKLLTEIPTFTNYSRDFDARALLQPNVRKYIPSFVLDKMTGILSDTIVAIFQWSLIPLTIALIFIIIMGKARLQTFEQMAANQSYKKTWNEEPRQYRKE